MKVRTAQINTSYIKMRWQEPYVTGGLNQKFFGIVPNGVYRGFAIEPGPGDREIQITTNDPFGYSGNVSGYAEGSYDPGDGYSIATYSSRQGTQTTIAIQEGVSGIETFDLSGYDDTTLRVVMKARYNINQWTDGQIEIVTDDEIDSHAAYIVLGSVDVPSSGTPIGSEHIRYDDDTYPRTMPYATWSKYGYMHSRYVRKLDQYEGLMFHKLTGGGTVSYAVSGTTVEWTNEIRIYVLGRDDVYYIDAGSVDMPNNGEVAYVTIPYGDPSGALTVTVAPFADVTAESEAGVAIPIFVRAYNLIYAGAGNLNLEPGEEATDGIDSNLPGDIKTLLGVSETANVWGFTNNFPGLSTQNAVERWSSLSLDDENLHEDRNIILSCSGDVAWNLGTLEWLEPFRLLVPNEAFDLYIPTGSVSGVDDDDVVYVTLDRSGLTPDLSVNVTANGSLPLDIDNKNHYLLGFRRGSEFIFRNGYIWRDGQFSSFENTFRLDDNLQWDAVGSRVIGTGTLSYYQGVGDVDNIEWDGYLYIRGVAGDLEFSIAPELISLADGQIVYAEIVRDQAIVPRLIWNSGSPVVQSVGAVDWTSGLTSGDWVKVKSQGDERYYQIDSVDSTTQVTLLRNFIGDSSGAEGYVSEYAINLTSIVVADRWNVPAGAYWLMMRDDRGSVRGRVQIKDIGELGEGESITENNWVYEESELTATEQFVNDLYTLPRDSRNNDVLKYYRVGSGDVQIYANGVALIRSPVTTVSGFSPSYNPATGFVTVDDSYDLTLVNYGDWFIDSVNNVYRVLGKVSNTLGMKRFYIGLSLTVYSGAGASIYRQDYEEVGSAGDLSNQIRWLIDIPKNAIITSRLHPINRPYADGSGSGPIGGGSGGGAGSLQDAYELGNQINVSGGVPFVVNGFGSLGKVARFIGDIEVTGVIDPQGITFIRRSSTPTADKDTIFVDDSGRLIYEAANSGTTVDITDQGRGNKTYENGALTTLLKGRIMTKNGVGKVKYADNTSDETSNVIGVLTQTIAVSASGVLQRNIWIGSDIIGVDAFVEGSYPSDNSLVFLSSTNGQMTITPPERGSGLRSLVVGIWDDGGLLWQIRDFGRA